MTVSASVEVKNKLGIHARPAMMLFELVQGFRCPRAAAQ